MVRRGAFSLYSLSGRGQIGKTHIYWVQNGIQRRKPYKVPANPQSVPQQANRALFASAVSAWHGESQETKDNCNLLASKLSPSIEGFNLYIRAFMLGEIP